MENDLGRARMVRHKDERMRCKHPRVTVNERANYYVCTDVEAGRCVMGYDSDPAPTGTGFVECETCHQIVNYSQSERGRRHLPKWALAAIRVFEDG